MRQTSRTSGGTFKRWSISALVNNGPVVSEGPELDASLDLGMAKKPKPRALLIIASHSANARECSKIVIPVSGTG
jgi:hypothetical protein